MHLSNIVIVIELDSRNNHEIEYDSQILVSSVNLICQNFQRVFTRGQYWPSGIVVACVCPSVRQSVRHQVCPRDNSSPVQARITKFGP